MRYVTATLFLASLIFSNAHAFTGLGDSTHKANQPNLFETLQNTQEITPFGLGLRLGEPTALSLQLNAESSHFLEFNLGSSNYYRDHDYYEDDFDRWYDDRGNGWGRYGLYDVDASSVVVMGSYNWRKSLEELTGVDGLNWYYGVGAEVRINTITYRYRYYNDDVNDWVRDQERDRNLDLGHWQPWA